MNGTNQPQMLPEPKRSTWLWVIIAIIAVLVLLVALYYYYYGYTPVPEGGPTGAADEVSVIEEDLGALDLGGLDVELSDIDKELAQ